MAAQTRLLIAAMIFGALLVGTQNVDVVPATVLGAVSAWLAVTMAGRARARMKLGRRPRSCFRSARRLIVPVVSRSNDYRRLTFFRS
jgi:hypothetical protein